LVAIVELLLGGGRLLVFSLVSLVARWVQYEKAGVDRWASLLPIYSTIERTRSLAGRPGGALVLRRVRD
jgi:hypothetical protein